VAPPVETVVPPVDAAAAPVAPPVPAVGTAPAADEAGDPPAVEDVTSPVHPAATKPAGGEVAEGPPAARRKPRTRRTDAERSLRGIVGAGSSQVGVVGAMRARDAARPTAEDLAAAERDLVIVRRHYVPPDNLPGAR
jgi:hypothetical protein